MRRVPFSLPEMALTDHAITRLTAALAATGGHWFTAEDGGTPIWRARAGASDLLPVAEAPELEAFTPCQGETALHLRNGVNGGYGWSEQMAQPSGWSAALIWTSGEDPARALLSLRGEGRNNYLYLHETPERRIELRDDAGESAVSMAKASPDAWQVTLISCTETTLALGTPGGPVHTAPAPSDLPHGATLLLGCRSHRPGLKKTLGAGRIRDLFIWPGRDILAETAEADTEMRAAFEHFCLWER